MKIIDLQQNTPEWKLFRLGKLTGSRLASIWSARPYTKADVENLLMGRGVDLKAFQADFNEKRKAEGLKGKAYVKADLEKLLSEDDIAVLSSDSEKKLEYYQVLADRYAIDWEDDEVRYKDPMDRGHQLEDTACMQAAIVLKKDLLVVGCAQADDNERVINSPDRFIKPKKTKSLSDKEIIDRVNSGKLFITEAIEAKCLSAAKHLMSFFERKIPEEYWTQKIQYFITDEKLETLYFVFYNDRLPILPLFILVVNREDVGHWPETMLKYQQRTIKELDDLEAQLLEVGDDIVLPARAEKGVVLA
jgi:hypothetical protein